MDYEKLYKKSLERASKLRFQNPFDTVSQMMEHVFPELKESEDEKHEQKAFRRIINDTADHILIGVHKESFNITDAVYKELLTALRQKIDAILEGGQHD